MPMHGIPKVHIASYMHLTKDASQYKCVTPKIQLTKDEAHQRCSMYVCTEIPQIHHTKDSPYQGFPIPKTQSIERVA